MTDQSPNPAGPASIDSRVVNRALRQVVWAALQPLSFTRRTQRTAWRDWPDSIQVVNFQSFNSYAADVMRTTSFSFAVNLGVFYPAIAEKAAVARFIKDQSRPAESHCHARKSLAKGMSQPDELAPPRSFDPRSSPTAGRWVDRPDVWFVQPDGSNLSLVISDALARILEIGLPWLERLSDLSEARRHFREVADTYQDRGVLNEHYGGTLGSPSRLHRIGALSAALGDVAGLNWAIDRMSVEPYYVGHPADLELLRGSRQTPDTS